MEKVIPHSTSENSCHFYTGSHDIIWTRLLRHTYVGGKISIYVIYTEIRFWQDKIYVKSCLIFCGEKKLITYFVEFYEMVVINPSNLWQFVIIH